MIELRNICKTYHTATTDIKALDHLDLTIRDNEFLALVGHSGCGKTTLLNILAGYDSYDCGSYLHDGIAVSRPGAINESPYFRFEIATVFQEYNLLPYLNIRDNIALAGRYRKTGNGRDRVTELLKRLDLEGMGRMYPDQLSGGQKQRVAIARALMKQPGIILADEPTGALDVSSARNIMNIFKTLHTQGMTIILVTHDLTIARGCQSIAVMEKGNVAVKRDLLPS